jgi:4-amino-4-deoxy-L-arabinose transferase-like glycosyltransferase
VTQTSNELPESQPLSTTARLLWLVLILATLYLCYFHNLGALGLVGPDEPRYAWIARDMQETGDWITPRLYGKPWFEKPPLYYWGAALSFKLFGVSEITARLPSAIFALLATLALAWLALRLYGAETARWLLLLLPTTVGMVGFSHAAATDMPFAATLTIAMVFAAKLLNLIPSPARQSESSATSPGSLRSFTSFTSSTSFTSILFGFFLGLATLAKGPAAIILSGGAVLLWAILTKRWRDAFRCLHPAAIASFCLTALPWYILCARRNPDFFRVFIIEHNFNRFLTPQFQHIQPFWFYIPILLIAFLPWTLALLWALLYGTLRYLPSRRPSPQTILLLCWPLFCLLFFSISKSKLPGYILPAIPAIALLLARALTSLLPQYEKSFRWLLTSFSILALLAAFALLWVGRALLPSKPSGLAIISAGCVLFLFGLANLLMANNDNRTVLFRFSAPLSVTPVLLALCTIHLIASPWLRYDPSGKTLAAELQANQLSSDLLVGPIARGQYFSLNFYLHREVKEWDKTKPQDGYLLLRSRLCRLEVVAPWTCSIDPIVLARSGWFIYRVQPDPSLDGLGGGSGGDAGSKLGDRQPR